MHLPLQDAWQVRKFVKLTTVLVERRRLLRRSNQLDENSLQTITVLFVMRPCMKRREACSPGVRHVETHCTKNAFNNVGTIYVRNGE